MGAAVNGQRGFVITNASAIILYRHGSISFPVYDHSFHNSETVEPPDQWIGYLGRPVAKPLAFFDRSIGIARYAEHIVDSQHRACPPSM